MAMSKKRVGRPSMPEDERAVLVPVRLPPDLIDQLDAEAKARVDRPSRSALIRELLAASLKRIRR